MARTRLSLAALALAVTAGLGGWYWYESQKVCCGFPDDGAELPIFYNPSRGERVGLMSSLPIYWPIGSDISEVVEGTERFPWQSLAWMPDYEPYALDTLSPYPSLSSDAPDVDPLAQLERLAVIQPRGLSPSDNVALDRWVRAGGKLLIVLDPQLTGHSEFALGDPRRPTDTALIPPVIARWGLEVVFDESQEPVRSFALPFWQDGYDVFLAGEVRVVDPTAGSCALHGEGVLAVCQIGDGAVTVLADAGIFEHGPAALANLDPHNYDDYDRLALEGALPLRSLVQFAFSRAGKTSEAPIGENTGP